MSLLTGICNSNACSRGYLRIPQCTLTYVFLVSGFPFRSAAMSWRWGFLRGHVQGKVMISSGFLLILMPVAGDLRDFSWELMLSYGVPTGFPCFLRDSLGYLTVL